MLIVFIEQCNNLYSAKRYFLSSALYVIGTFLGTWGCATFVKASYPDEIVSSCFYSNESIEPPAGAWWFRIHFGTRVLRSGQLQLLGAMTVALASAVWIQEDYQYNPGENVWEYIELVFANLLLVSGCIYQLLGQYPQSVLNRHTSNQSSTWLVTDLQVSGWYFEILSVLWLLRSAIRFDDSTISDKPVKEGEEEPSVPFSEYDWVAFGDCWLSLLMAVGSYFVLAQAYREGTRMDAVLIQQAKRITPQPDLEESLPERKISSSSGMIPTSQKLALNAVATHPLRGIRDLTDSKTVLRRARKVANDLGYWQAGKSKNSDVQVWVHTQAHAVRFETKKFQTLDPLLLAAVIQSESFKSYQLRAAGASSVQVVGKLAGALSEGAVVFFEKISPNPPMPAHESTFASLLHETRRPDGQEAVAEVLEWSINETRTERVKVSPFRYWSVDQSGVLRGMVWLEDIARWMPEFLLKTEMGKVPLIVEELEAFFQRSKDTVETTISKNLNTWIWQKVHNSISPLAAAVLVRTSPAYRVLLSKYPGLRTRVPEPVSVPVGALVHPLDHFPVSLNSDADIDVPVAVKHGADFITNEFVSWHASEADSRAKSGRAKVTVWRQEMEGERIKPFRIQARIHGIDPLTLAMLIHRNRLNELMDAYQSNPAHFQRTSDPSAMFRQSIDPMKSRQSVSSSPERVAPDQSVLGSMMGEDHVTVSNNLVATFQHGAVRVYRERKRRTKFMPGSREREFTFASVMKDVSPLKAVVVHFGVNDVLGGGGVLSSSPPFQGDQSVVKLRRFHAWSLENDGGTDTKFTWCGLVPVGGRTEKLSAWLSSGSELKEKTKFVEKLAGMFVSDMRAREAIAECHQYLAFNSLRSAMGRELKRLSVSYLSHTSSDYKTLLSEIQPPNQGGILGFEQDLPHVVEMKKRRLAEAKRRRDEDDDDDERSGSSEVTVPLSPVESHRKMDSDDEDEVRTQKKGELLDSEDVIPQRGNY